MPLYIAKSWDLDRCYRCLTDWQTTLKDRATQLLIKYKSGALVTQYKARAKCTLIYLPNPPNNLSPTPVKSCCWYEPYVLIWEISWWLKGSSRKAENQVWQVKVAFFWHPHDIEWERLFRQRENRTHIAKRPPPKKNHVFWPKKKCVLHSSIIQNFDQSKLSLFRSVN